MPGLTAVPRNHFEDVQGTCTHTLSATDAGVVDLDGVGHVPVANEDVVQNVPAEQALDAPAVTVVNDELAPLDPKRAEPVRCSVPLFRCHGYVPGSDP